MKNSFYLITLLFTFQAFSQETSECIERTMPYWAHGINSRIEGEVPTLQNAFQQIQIKATNIEPANGFITLRLSISKNGELCDLETFQIDENYNSTIFNKGELIKELETIAVRLTDWKRDKNYKTYNLIRLKIKDGRIEEVF